MKEKERLAWFAEEHLIHDSSLPGNVKHLLLVIHTSVHYKKQTCWLSQPKLARKMGMGRATVQRAFYATLEAGVLANKLVRTGKGKTDQHNEYSIVWEKLHELSTHQDEASSENAVAITGSSEEASIKNEGS